MQEIYILKYKSKKNAKKSNGKQSLQPISRFIWQRAAPFEMNAVESRIFEIRNENIDVPMLTTGGSGTTMYYVAAAAVAAACAAIYVIRKRKRS